MSWASSSENLGGLAGQFLKRNLLFIWSSQCGLGNANRLKMVDHATSCLVMKALNLGKLLDKRWVEKREGSSLFAIACCYKLKDIWTQTTNNFSRIPDPIRKSSSIVQYCFLPKNYRDILDKKSASRTVCNSLSKRTSSNMACLRQRNSVLKPFQ